MSRKIRLAQCWHCGYTVLSHPSLYQFVSKPNNPMDMFTCDCLKEPYPDAEEADYGEIT
jgi:hypothetical protein